MRRLAPLCTCTCISLAAPAAFAQTLTEVWSLDGFTMPESAHFDEASGQIIVSNIGTFGPDGGMDGTLSLVSPDGAMIAADWVTGLMDPKGMATAGGKLYVADAMGLQVVDLATGTLEGTIELPGAMFPNDVTADESGAVYVSEFMGGGIFRVEGEAAELWMDLGSLPLPNGLLVHGETMIVGSFGDEMEPDFSVKNPGGLLAVDMATKAVSVIEGTEASGSVDGIVSVGDALLYDDNPTGRILLSVGGDLIEIGNGGPGAADMGIMGDTLLVPNLNTGTLTAYQLTN